MKNDVSPPMAAAVPRPSKFQRFFNTIKRQKALQVMALLGVVWMIIFHYIPLTGLWIAFSHFNIARPIFDAPFAGLTYFRQFFSDPNIPRVLYNTLGISFFRIVIGFPIPIIFAIFLSEMRHQRYKKLVQTVSYLPHFVSWVILGGFIINWTAESGLINDILLRTGLRSTPIHLLGDARYFWGVAVVSDIWRSMGWGAIIYIAAIASINPELYEGALIDGANRFRRIWHITLPSIKGTIAILFTFAVAGLLSSNFEQVFVLRNPLNIERAMVLDLYIFQVGIRLGRFSYATAVGLMRSIVALVLLIVANRVSDRLTGASFI